MTALGAKLMSMHGDKNEAKESNIMNRDDTEMEDEAGKGQVGEEDKGWERKEDECLEGNGQEGDDINNQDGNEDNGFEGNIHADDDGYVESE